MNNETLRPEDSGVPLHMTTAWRKWLGWVGVMTWWFLGNNIYSYIRMGFDSDVVYWTNLSMKLIFMISIAVFGWLFGRDPNGVGRVAFYTTPVVVVLTAAFPFFVPSLLSCVIFALSPIFMAPLLVRRLYGMIRTANPDRVLFTFMSGLAAAMLIMQLLLFPYEFQIGYKPPLTLTFLFMAAFPLLSWLGVRRQVPYTGKEESTVTHGISKTLLLVFVAAVLLSFWLLRTRGFIEYAIEQYDDFLYIPVYVVLPPVCYFLFGYLGYKKRERFVFIGVIIAHLFAIQIAFLAGHNPDSYAELPLVITNRLFGTVIEYLNFTAPIYFLIRAKRPVFVASLCIAIYTLNWAFRWGITPFLPDVLADAGAPLYIATAIPLIVFFVLLYYIFMRYKEMTLVAALYTLLHGGTAGHKPVSAEDTPDMPESTEATETQGMINTGLTQDEVKIAMLMIDGISYRDIARKLNMSADDFNRHEKEIRQKLKLMSDPDPIIAAVTADYMLTKREAKILSFLRDNKANDEIAAELYLSEDTVKVHVRNLMKKLPVEKRSGIPAWMETYESKTK